VIDYPCAKFGSFSFNCFGFIVQTDRQTDRIPDSDDRYTRVTAVGVCNSPGDAVMFLFVRQTSNCSKYTACVICLMILLAYLWDCVTDCT